MTSGRIELPDASLYFEVAGEGPALVFAHGLGGDHLSWWQQVPAWWISRSSGAGRARALISKTGRAGANALPPRAVSDPEPKILTPQLRCEFSAPDGEVEQAE